MNKKTFIIVGIAGSVIIALVVLLQMADFESSSEVSDQQVKEMILPEIEKQDSLSKTEIYMAASKPKTQSKLSLDDIYKMGEKEKKKDTVSKDSSSLALVTRPGQEDEKVKQEPQQAKQPVKVVYREKPSTEPKKPTYTGGGLGVYKAETTMPKTTEKKPVTTRMEGFNKARFEKDFTLKDRSEVVLINDEPFMYGNVRIEKFALLFGTVQHSTSRFMIKINTIKNVDNTKYRVNYDVFNTQYQKGIYYEYSQGEKDTRQIGSTSIDAVTTDVRAKVAAKAVDVLNNPNKKEHKKRVYEGDLVFIKESTDN